METSMEGTVKAIELALLALLDEMGVRNRIAERVEQHCEDELPSYLDNRLADARDLARSWKTGTPDSANPAPDSQTNQISSESKDAVLEGQAAGRLALSILWPVLNKLDMDYLNEGKEKFISGGVFKDVFREVTQRAPTSALYEDMSRLLKEGFASSRHDWKAG